jgi:hypothetical protein
MIPFNTIGKFSGGPRGAWFDWKKNYIVDYGGKKLTVVARFLVRSSKVDKCAYATSC